MLITGTMGNYLKNLELQQKWQKKKDDEHLTSGMKVVTKNAASQKGAVYTSAMEDFMKEQEEFRSKIKSLLRENSECSRSSVEFKLQYGGKLSPRELEYIKNNCPDLYAKAAEREKERRQYAAQLRNCNSKDEVFALRMGKLSSLMGECRAAEARGDYGASFELRARLYNIEEEHAEYLKSDEYQGLCRKEKTEKEAAEKEAQEKNAAEAPEENATQDGGIIPSDEEKTHETETETSPGQEQELPGMNPGAANDKVKPDAGKRSRHEAHRLGAEGKMKFTADKYQKNKAEIVSKNFDVKLDAPLNPNPNIPGGNIVELLIKGEIIA